MGFSIRTGLSEVDKQLVLKGAVRSFQAMKIQATNFLVQYQRYRPQKVSAEERLYDAAVQNTALVSAINIACLWFDSPQVSVGLTRSPARLRQSSISVITGQRYCSVKARFIV